MQLLRVSRTAAAMATPRTNLKNSFRVIIASFGSRESGPAAYVFSQPSAGPNKRIQETCQSERRSLLPPLLREGRILPPVEVLVVLGNRNRWHRAGHYYGGPPACRLPLMPLSASYKVTAKQGESLRKRIPSAAGILARFLDYFSGWP